MSFHFLVFINSLLQGDGAPKNIHPDFLTQVGVSRQSRTAQFFPRQSKEAKENQEHINQLQEVFKDVFAWQRTVVSRNSW